MQGLRNQRKFLSVKAKDGPGRALKNVLTAKNGRFWGPFGRKTGGPLQKKDTFFRVFSIFGDFVPRKRLKLRMFHRFDPSKKNRAQKPTVGFWVIEGYGKCWSVQGASAFAQTRRMAGQGGACSLKYCCGQWDRGTHILPVKGH
jgi:hypothetical protein